MFDLFESIAPTDLEQYLRSLNMDIGESGAILNTNSLLSTVASCQYYHDTREKIALVVRGLVKNHPFVDGNKRTALIFYLLMSKLGGLDISLDKEQLEQVFVSISSNNYSVEEISKLLYNNLDEQQQLREWINLLS